MTGAEGMVVLAILATASLGRPAALTEVRTPRQSQQNRLACPARWVSNESLLRCATEVSTGATQYYSGNRY